MITTIFCGDAEGNGAEPVFCEGKVRRLEGILSAYLEKYQVMPEAAKECEVSLTFVSEQQMGDMNLEYREIAGPTDVLSFPMWENEEGNFEPPDDWETVTLGDIIVCPEIVRKNAAENNKSEESETLLVVCHGFLHLIGFDHAEEEERDEMWQAQEELVAQFEALE